MSQLTTKIGAYNPETRAVSVTFTSGSVKHTRDVNAVLATDGTYDRAATKLRVDEVAQGVAQKITVGAITNPPPEPDLPKLTKAAGE